MTRTATTADVSLLTADDLHLFNEGTHRALAAKLGAHPIEAAGTAGTYFAVWAPSAAGVAVAGDFNGWDAHRNSLRPRDTSGIWEGFVPEAGAGATYKYAISTGHGDHMKADPFARQAEEPPRTASVIWDGEHRWEDGEWMAARGGRNALDAPIAIYELHLGSWRRRVEEGRPLTYLELAEQLPGYVRGNGFTHVEFLPVMEHPFTGSWGYQTTGYFAPTSRYGRPEDLMALVDALHNEGIGVIFDWVPSHFATDPHGLALFDGTHLYEHSDPRQGFHPDWGSYIFNYGRNEVRSFLLSSAHHWLDAYHADGLRVDAVASMLYLDYSRSEGEWIPNQYGGRENLEAIELLRALNGGAYGEHPDIQTYAEESTAWPMVSRPTYLGGLGFGLKWDMGWMHDTLAYFEHDPIHRRHHHHELTFRGLYAFTENYVLPLSHDEVVHGKRSLLSKMPGNDWQRRANMRALYGYMYAVPGKKLLFMGAELGQWQEWNHDVSIDWHLLDDPAHEGIRRWVADLNRVYRDRPALHELDCDPEGFEWVHASDSDSSVLAFLRRSRDGSDLVLAVMNLTPVPRPHYRVGAPRAGFWREIANSDALDYGGSGAGNMGGAETAAEPVHGREDSLLLTLPPLSCLLLAHGDGA
ncbi:MAG TPA: 1,4-alpha-glucan branching protein GlgB [Gaiellales bacterium]|nr:1,4-alpha-glucan branching protein GlgB [Gaiellales bacterium]